MAPRVAALIESNRTVRQDVQEGLDIPTKGAPIVYPLTPSFKIVQGRQSVYTGVDGKFKDSLRDIPQKALPSDTTIFFHN